VRRRSRLHRLYRAATATRRARVVTVAAVAVVGIVAGVVVSQTGDGGAKRGSSAVVLSESGLETLAKTLHTIYWVGPQPGMAYELRAAPDGRIFLRYVPAGSKPGVAGEYLSLGTYPLVKAFAATVRAAGKKDFVRVQAGDGVAAVYAGGRPTNVYLAFRGVDYQVELFDRDPARARKLVIERRVVPVP
jgi:hypothetical protein